jgi:signal transduction histidine kinase/CheY-like chemotaxis protein/ABC-type amino acid transport substrate-binding protein
MGLRGIAKILCLPLVAALVWAGASSCGNIAARPLDTRAAESPFTTFLDIPGLTQEEIDVVRRLQKEQKTFIYGMNPSSETFVGEDDEIYGFTALLCDWMSGMLGVTFKPAIYQWGNLIKGLETGEIDFTGELTSTEERRQTYLMTGAIAERAVKYFRIGSGAAFDDAARSRPPRYAFLSGTATWRAVTASFVGRDFETVFIDDARLAYGMLKDGSVDAFFAESHCEYIFEKHGDITAHAFVPLIYESVSLTARKPELAPIISIMQKAISNGGRRYLAQIYNKGYGDYLKHKMRTRLTDDECLYMLQNPVVKFAAEYDNYPVSFYNMHDKEWQGIAFDVMREIERLTGLKFERANTDREEWSTLLGMLRGGEASMITELLRTSEREGHFLWPKNNILSDRYALLSKSEYPNLTINEILNARVAITKETAYAERFKSWFPDHRRYVEYENYSAATDALTHGDVDMLMSSRKELLSLINNSELPGYKVNFVFDQELECTFGFNTNEGMLAGIVDKALALVNVNAISDDWMYKTYDYREKLEWARLPWLIGALSLFLCVVALMFVMIRFRRHESDRLEKLVDMRTGELNRQNSLMSTVNAAAAILLEPDIGEEHGSINHSMEMICDGANVDRVSLWQNVRKEDGKLSYKQVCTWTRSGEPIVDSGPVEFAYGETPYMESVLSDGKSMNGPVDVFPENERLFFSARKAHSVLAVPLFLEGQFLGFVSFNDYHQRRYFPEAEEFTLRSWGLLVVGALQRDEIMQALQITADEARNASDAKSRFVANMSHEMRTPMNVIVGLTDLLIEEDSTPDDTKETLRKINTAGNTLMGLINDVLDISKIEAGKLELTPVQYDLASLLNDIVTLNIIRIGNKPIKFNLDVSEDLPASLLGDDLRVKQILNNLLSNAFKYTREGSVVLGFDCERVGDNVWASFYVRDTGIGIRKEDIPKLFTDYNQVDTRANRKIEGTGLGLSISKKFVELMGGEITVESEHGKGTTFRARIRQGFVDDRAIGKDVAENLRSFRHSDKKKLAREKLNRPDLSYAKALVVDDFPTNLDVAAGMLRKYKMQVDCVDNGFEAVRRMSSEGSRYDAVFMDHMMPEMDGIEATQRIRAIGTEYAKRVPIVALTANAVAGNEKMFLDKGFDAFLSKPINIMTLDTIVKQFIMGKSKEQG